MTSQSMKDTKNGFDSQWNGVSEAVKHIHDNGINKPGLNKSLGTIHHPGKPHSHDAASTQHKTTITTITTIVVVMM